MIEYFWTCQTCGLETYNEEEREMHVKSTARDPLHTMARDERQRRQYIGITPQLETKSVGSYFCKSHVSVKTIN